MSKALLSQLSAGRGHGFCGFLCQWLCECHVCLRGFLASYKGPQAEVTSEGGAGSGNLCGHARQVASENRMSQCGHLLWKSVQQLLSRWSPPGVPALHQGLESDLWLLPQQPERRARP